MHINAKILFIIHRFVEGKTNISKTIVFTKFFIGIGPIGIESIEVEHKHFEQLRHYNKIADRLDMKIKYKVQASN